MKLSCNLSIVLICLITLTSFQPGIAMDEPSEQTAGATGQTSKDTQLTIMNLPYETMAHILKLTAHKLTSTNIQTYLQVAQLMKLRQVCSLWNSLLTDTFIKKHMAPALKPTNQTDLIIKLSRAIKGSGRLAADATQFVLRKFWPVDSQVHENALRCALAEIFGRNHKISNNVTTFAFNDKFIINHKAMKALRHIFANVDPNHFQVVFDNSVCKSMLLLCLETSYKDAQHKHELFNLLLSRGLDVTDKFNLLVIAQDYHMNLDTRSNKAVLSTLLSSPHAKDTNYICVKQFLQWQVMQNAEFLRDANGYLFSQICEHDVFARIHGCNLRNFNAEIFPLIDFCLQTTTPENLLSIAAVSCNPTMLQLLIDEYIPNSDSINLAAVLKQLTKGYHLLTLWCTTVGQDVHAPDLFLHRCLGVFGTSAIDSLRLQIDTDSELAACFQTIDDAYTE